MKRKNMIILLILVIILMMNQQPKKTADACEATRTCCENIGLNYVCFRNDPVDFSVFDVEDIKAGSGNSQSWEGASFFMHPRNGYFYSNQGDLNYGWGMKGGMTRIKSPMYGNARGWTPSNEGAVQYAEWYPHKIQAYNQQNTFEYEIEVLYLRNAVVMKNRVLCKNPAGCTQSSGTPVTYKMQPFDSSIGGSSQVSSTPVYGTYGGYPGYVMNIAGTGWTNPAFDKNWYFLVNSTPDSNSVVGTDGQIFYELANGETRDFTFIVLLEDDLAQAADMIQNYDTYEQQAKSDFEEYANGFSKISGTDSEQALYYRSIFGLYTYMFPAHGEIPNNFITPNIGRLQNPVLGLWASGTGTSNYMGQWVWDSAVAALGWVTQCNPGETCWQDLKDVQANWEMTQFKNEEGPMCPEIHGNGLNVFTLGCNINVPGLWSMITYNKYLKDSNQADMCNFYPNLKSNHQWITSNRDGDGNNLFSAGAGEMGRDGSGNYVSTDSTAVTGWMMLDALYLSKIAAICAPTDVTLFENKYNTIRSAYETSFWDSTHNTYCYIDSPGVCKTMNGVVNEDALTLSFANIFNTHGGSKDELVETRMVSRLTDTYFPTSSPTAHPCYSAHGKNEEVDPACWPSGGATWEGPVWPQDEFLVNEMYMKMVSRSVPGASTSHQAYKTQTIDLYNTLPFPAESYNSNTGFSAQWGAFPHSSNSGYIIYQLSGQEMIEVTSTPQVITYSNFQDYSFNYITGATSFSTFITQANTWVTS